MNKNEASNIRERALLFFLAVRDFAAAVLSMYWTRNWLTIYLLVGLNLALLGLPLTFGIAGHFWPTNATKLSLYGGLAVQETRNLSEGANFISLGFPAGNPLLVSTAVTSNTPNQNFYYSKLALIEDRSKESRFGLALALQARGQTGQAREMIAELSELPGMGYGPAHVWMARDLLSQGTELNLIDKQQLLKHLEAACRTKDSPADIVAIYSQLLTGLGRIDDARELLTRASAAEFGLKLALSRLHSESGDSEVAEALLNEFEDEFNARVKDSTLTAVELQSVITVSQILNDFDRALALSEIGVLRWPNDQKLKRRLSNLFLAKYRKSIRTIKDRTSVDLGYIERAIKADCTNPRLDQELLQIMEIHSRLNPATRLNLRDQLQNGESPVVLNLVFAGEQLAWTNVDEAARYLTNAHESAADCPVVIKLMARVLAEQSNPVFDRAEELINRCIDLRGSQPDALETLGQIYLRQGKLERAIQVFNKAADMAPHRIESRRLLAETLEVAGEVREAKQQRGIVRELEDYGKSSIDNSSD